MKEILRKILAALLVLAFVGYLLGTGIYELVNTKDRYTVNIDECGEILEVENSINGIIPTGTDHYYVGLDRDSGEAYILQATEKWYEKNFDQDMTAVAAGGLEVTALSKRVNDYEVRNELESRVNSIKGSGVQFPAGTEHRLDVSYKVKAFGKLAIVLLGVVLAAIVIWVAKSGRSGNKVIGGVVLVISVLLLFLILQVIR